MIRQSVMTSRFSSHRKLISDQLLNRKSCHIFIIFLMVVRSSLNIVIVTVIVFCQYTVTGPVFRLGKIII